MYVTFLARENNEYSIDIDLSKTDGWPWIHLEQAGSSGCEVVTGTKSKLFLSLSAK